MTELLLKASLAIAIGLLFYKLFLQQESFFATNRIYLLVCLVLAFTLPNITLPKLVEQQGYLSAVFQPEPSAENFTPQETNIYKAPHLPANAPVPEDPSEEIFHSEEVAETKNTILPPQQIQQKSGPSETMASSKETSALTESFSWAFWITSIYLFGVAVFSLSLLYQLGWILLRIVKARDKVRDGDCTIINTAQKQAPCSFFNFIFIHPDDYDFETYEQIIAHEKTHVKLGHSFDVLLAELAVILLWFNPLIWFYRREIEKNNEYQTDALLLEKDRVQKEKYQMNLLHIAAPNKPLNITTNYNQSLLKQRIMMMNSKKSTPTAYWKYSFLLPIFFGMLLLINEPAASQDKKEMETKVEENSVSNEKEVTLTQAEPQVLRQEVTVIESEAVVESVNEAVQEEQREVIELSEPIVSREPLSNTRTIIIQKQDMSTGYWYSNRENGRICFQFKGSKNQSTWNISKCFDVADLQKKENNVFEITNEIGTMLLTGNVDAEVKQGKYTFKENPSFKNYLAQNDISTTKDNFMFHLFFGDVTRSYVDFLKREYNEVEGKNLMELAIHGISEERFKSYIDLFQKYSNTKPTIRKVVEARIHRLDEAYVEEIRQMGFRDLSMEKMMQARIHGVSASYANDLRNASFDNLSIDKIIEARIHRIDPATIREMNSLGYGELSLEKIKELKIHKVNADYIQSLRNAGFNDLPLDDVISARIHRVDPATIREMRALGFGDLSLEKIRELKIHGVDADFIQQLQTAIPEDLSLSQILEAKIHRLTPESIAEIREMGYDDLKFRDLMTAKIHRIDVAYVEDLRKAGFTDLPMDKVVSAKIHGINSKFIEQSREKGYDLNSIDKYISLKIHGNALERLKD